MMDEKRMHRQKEMPIKRFHDMDDELDQGSGGEVGQTVPVRYDPLTRSVAIERPWDRKNKRDPQGSFEGDLIYGLLRDEYIKGLPVGRAEYRSGTTDPG